MDVLALGCDYDAYFRSTVLPRLQEVNPAPGTDDVGGAL
jgi:hypothetical protein